jgi:hypothetical protein
MPEVDEVMVKLMVEVISTLTLVTGKLKKRRLRKSSSHSLMCCLTQGGTVKWIKNFFGVKDINAARQKLKRLLREEERAVGAQILGLADGERISFVIIHHLLNTLLPQDNKATLGTFNVFVRDNKPVRWLTEC